MNSHENGVSVNLSSITRSFPNSGLVLDHLTLTVPAGEFVSILGPSGCGKSTLLRLFGNLDSPDGGQISFGGDHLDIRRGFVFQEPRLLPWLSALDNVALPLLLQGHSQEQAQTRAHETIRRVDLADALQKFPRQLSGGMKMRVSIARALGLKPNLLLLDEPFSALDEHTRHSFQSDLRNLWKDLGMTVVFVTHSIAESVFLSNRVVILSKFPGRIIRDHAVNLPDIRPPQIRMTPAFQNEVRELSNFLPLRLEL